jgi:tetratricopeptide (TPR) repeat protein
MTQKDRPVSTICPPIPGFRFAAGHVTRASTQPRKQRLPLEQKNLYSNQPVPLRLAAGDRMFDAEGLDLLQLARKQVLKGDYAEALRSFQLALQLLVFDGNLAVHPQYLSHYGVALAGSAGKIEEGRRLCERSIQLEPYEPEHYLNLGVVLQMRGDQAGALTAFSRGLAVRSDHPDLLERIRTAERRRTVLFPALPRNHVLNRCLGRIIAARRLTRLS